MKNNPSCTSDMNFQECELAILRSAVDKAEEVQSKKAVNSPNMQKMIRIVEQFLKRKKLVCYGGTAINALLPKADKFYNKETDIADYDFFSKDPLKDAKELADIYYKEGFEEVEAKSGQHYGTYKVFVNFVGMADITYLHKDIYNALKQEARSVGGILYCPPNFLRMSMYLELSRPAGDVGRWEKVLKRLSLLNKHYPLEDNSCEGAVFQRKLEDSKGNDIDAATIYENVRDTLVSEGVVFFGGYAITNYMKYMPKKISKKLQEIPDFDVLAEDAEMTALIVKENLEYEGVKKVRIVKNKPVGEIISTNYQIIIGDNDTIAFIYEPMACHSYNVIDTGDIDIRIATIDTMLSLYLAFLYAGRNYYDLSRLVCMSKFLYDVQQKNRLKQKGLLKRFSISCYGHQETVEEMRAEKTEMFEKLKNDRSSPDYEKWFLRYKPVEVKNSKSTKPKTQKSKTKPKTQKTKSKTSKKNKKKNKKTKKVVKNRSILKQLRKTLTL